MRTLTGLVLVTLIVLSFGAIAPTHAQTGCGSAPAPRLVVGQMARVTVGAGVGNNLRAAADTNATVLGVMPDGEVFTVVAGPQCVGEKNYWQARRWDGQTGWTAEGAPGDYWLEPWPVANGQLASGQRPAPDGSVIAYSNGSVINVITLDNALVATAPALITPQAQLVWQDAGLPFAFSPDGSKLLYMMPAPGNATAAIPAYLTLDSQPPAAIVDMQVQNFQADWSSTGLRFAYTATSGGTTSMLMVAGADGINMTSVVPSTPPVVNDPATIGAQYDPDWSPDGTQLVFTGEYKNDTDIFVITPATGVGEGTNLIRLTDNDTPDYHPTWSPDGTQIAFVSERDGNAELYLMNADGTDVTRLTNTPNNEGYPVFSPDGSRIAFTATMAPEKITSELFSIRTDGTDLLQYTVDNRHVMHPSWSPDGQWLIFSTDRTGNYDIFIMRASGAALVRITSTADNEVWATWAKPATTPTGVVIAPTATPAAGVAVNTNPSTTDLLLIYDASVPVFTLKNTSGQAINLMPLSFSGAGTTFMASQWQNDSLASPLSSFMAGGCLQAWRFGIAEQAAPTECGTARQSWITYQGTFFWTQGSFNVLYNNAVVATCDVAAGRCTVDLP
jgi:Tol biopolymer transport system component